MDERVFIPIQGLATAVIAIGGVLACGHPAGLPCVVVLLVGMFVWLGFASAYYLRASGSWRDWRGGDGRALVNFALGFLPALAVAAGASARADFDGLLFESAAATFGCVVLVLIPVAILVSSSVDWYLILPLALGAFGLAAWESEFDERHQRRLAQYWIAHRGICELFVFSSIALVLAVGLVAIGNAVSDDNTLPEAIESLGGAGIAFGVLGYAGPRWKASMDFVLSGPIGVGMWVEGTDEVGQSVTGLVADISVAPGVKVISYDPGESMGAGGDDWQRSFVALAAAKRLGPASRPTDIEPEWVKRMMLLHLGKDAEHKES
jgi:hypothetical protein